MEHRLYAIFLAPSNVTMLLHSVLFRIRHRTIDASQEEIRAEAQLTTRYWKFLKSVSSAILYVRAAEVEAAALAVRPRITMTCRASCLYLSTI